MIKIKRAFPFLLALAFGAAFFLVLKSLGPSEIKAASTDTESSVFLHEGDPETVFDAPSVSAPPAVLMDVGDYGNDIVAEEEGLTIYRVQGKRYKGLLAVVEDVSRLTVGTCGTWGGYGKTVQQMADDSGAVLCVNGGGFLDEGGKGKGGSPTGNVFSGGVQLSQGYSATHTIGMDSNGKLHCGYYGETDCSDLDLQWALSYGPTLIIDGVAQNVGNNINEEPRTAVGQREDGTVLILCLQGRQPSALGVTEAHLAQIMLDLGCVNAGNLDGGASTAMVYRGNYISIANSGGWPRTIPTCLMLMPPEEE